MRIYADGRYSCHRTTDLDPDRLATFWQAVAITRALEPDPYREITPPNCSGTAADNSTSWTLSAASIASSGSMVR